VRLYSTVASGSDDPQTLLDWITQKTRRFPVNGRYRISIELITPEPTTATETDDMPKSGRKVSPWRQYTEKANARTQDKHFWQRKKQEQTRAIREAEQRRDRERAERERKAREVTNRSVKRAREDARKAREKARKARDSTGRRGGGGEPKEKKRGQGWGGW
jgi:hypothetical protein